MAKLALGRASDSCHFAASLAAWQKYTKQREPTKNKKEAKVLRGKVDEKIPT